jgi:hypothetical protein
MCSLMMVWLAALSVVADSCLTVGVRIADERYLVCLDILLYGSHDVLSTAIAYIHQQQ